MNEVATLTETRPYRWAVDDYLAVAETGIFDLGGRVELIDGEILAMAPMQTIHGFLVAETSRRLANALDHRPGGLRVYIGATVKMPQDSAPEPDIIVSAVQPGFSYLHGDQAALLVEIANSSVDHDLIRKAALYARHAVPEYWVVEVQANCIHRHWSPGTDGYAEKDRVDLGETCASHTIAGLAIATDGLAFS